MMNDTRQSDRHLKRILDGAARVYAALNGDQNPRATRRHRQFAGAQPWLQSQRVAVAFRTSRSASLAAIQFAAKGYTAIVTARTVVVEAPWYLVAAVVTGIGLRSELRGIHRTDGRATDVAAPRSRLQRARS